MSNSIKNPTTNPAWDDLATIDASELGKLIGRSTKSIKVDVSRRPDTLPPTFRIPGTRKIVWRVVDVRAWMQAIAELETERRRVAAEVMKKTGGGTAIHNPFHLGRKDIGLKATEHLASKS